MTQLGIGMGRNGIIQSPCMGMAPIYSYLMGINSHRRMQCLAYVIETYNLLYIMAWFIRLHEITSKLSDSTKPLIETVTS